MSQANAQRLREANKAAFMKLLEHLGRKEFDAFEACLSEDMVQEWPYRPLPSLPERVVGASTVRRLIEAGMSDFDPYNYRITVIHDLVNPDLMIAEYTSHSFYRRRQVPYENKYISILRFRDGKLVHWTEYVNPLIVKEALLDDFGKTVGQRTGRDA
jgi:ketosteroid isomerase-like protein